MRYMGSYVYLSRLLLELWSLKCHLHFVLMIAKNQWQFGQNISVHLKDLISSFKKMPWIIEFWALVLIWPDPIDWLAPDIFAKDIANIWALYEWLFCPFLLEILNFVFKANMIRNMEGHKIELSFVHTRNMSTVKRFIRIYLSFLNIVHLFMMAFLAFTGLSLRIFPMSKIVSNH